MEIPEFGSWTPSALKNWLVIICNGDGLGVKSNGATAVAKLADREERHGGKRRNDMGFSCGGREIWDLEMAGMSRSHDGTVGSGDGERTGAW